MWNGHKSGVEVWTNAGAYSKTVQNGATQGRRICGVAKSRSRGSGRVMEIMILKKEKPLLNKSGTEEEERKGPIGRGERSTRKEEEVTVIKNEGKEKKHLENGARWRWRPNVCYRQCARKEK